MDYENIDVIEDYLEGCLKENSSALMYYCCYDYDGGVYPADHSKLDLDPTTRQWWIDCQTAGGLIYRTLSGCRNRADDTAMLLSTKIPFCHRRTAT